MATPCNKGSAENSFYLIIRNEKLLIKVPSHVKKKKDTYSMHAERAVLYRQFCNAASSFKC